MTTTFRSVPPGLPAATAADLLRHSGDSKHLDWVPIVDGHTLVGAITPAELAVAEYRPIPSAS